MNKTTKTIHLLRHAAKDFSCESDFLTPLTRKGEEQAARLGTMMKGSGIKPHLILCSESLRTRQTRDGFLKTAEFDHDFESKEDLYLYEGRYSEIFNRIQELSDTVQSVLLIGHEPQMSQLIAFLASEKSKEEHFGWVIDYPPCTLTSIEISAENWADIQPESNMILSVLKP